MTNPQIEKLKEKNYVRLAQQRNDYWVDFSRNKLFNFYVAKFGIDFNIILYSEPGDHAGYYVIPFKLVQHLFKDEFLAKDQKRTLGARRWVVLVINHIFRVTNCPETVDVRSYYFKPKKTNTGQAGHYMQTTISETDIALAKELNSKAYPDLTMKGVVSIKENEALKDLQHRLKNIADFFKARYDEEYGTFQSDRASGNPIGRTGKLRRIWSGVFKGTENKQYAAQISFVINTEDSCLDVGFYFGRASAQDMKKDKRAKLESHLNQLGALLFQKIQSNPELRTQYDTLFDLGFMAHIVGERVDANTWLNNANINPKHSSITYSLFPNSLGFIDLTAIDACVSFVMPLMLNIPENIEVAGKNKTKKIVPPLTPEQRAKQAEMRAMIGLEGEKFVLAHEKINLRTQNIQKKGYPCHQSLLSDSFGYDILSCNANGDLFIEVKTTTRLKGEHYAGTFYMSVPEYEFYNGNKRKYRLYRVYDIYGNPEIEIIDLTNMTFHVDGYKVTL
jgi:hypothetical protein